MAGPQPGPDLAQRLSDEYATTVRSGKPSHVEALDRIRSKSPFKKTFLQGWIKKIGQTPKGAIEILLMVPFEQRAEALELINAYGMPLDFYIHLINEPPPDAWATEFYKDNHTETELVMGYLADG